MLTIAWLAFGTLVVAGGDVNDAERTRQSLIDTCVGTERGLNLPIDDTMKAIDRCYAAQGRAPAMSDYYGEALSLVAVIAAIAWILGGAAYWSVRWILAGRKKIH